MNKFNIENVTDNKSSNENKNIKKMQTYIMSNLTEQFNSANDVENDNNKKRNFVVNERIHEMQIDENFQLTEKIENSRIEKINENVNNKRCDDFYNYRRQQNAANIFRQEFYAFFRIRST